MVRKTGRRAQVDNSWSAQLGALLTAAEMLVGPPVGSNKSFAEFARRLRSLILKLDHLSEQDFLDAVESLSQDDHRRRDQRGIVDEELRYISLEEVEARIADPASTKQDLLALARERFGAATGTLERLPRSALVERVGAFVMHEQSHRTLEKLASRAPGGKETDATVKQDPEGPATLQSSAQPRDRERLSRRQS